MLLPSDIARLVLGYLQQENLTSTCQTFILESSNLKEYAEHCKDDGFIPACLLSLFGKNLTTILNEYVAMKAKETSNDGAAIMASLWKKLDHTLSQIRNMHNSPGYAATQRARTRSGIAEIKRQRRLASQAAPVSSALLTLPYPSEYFTATPLTTTQVTRQAGQISTPLRSNFIVVNHSQAQDTVPTGETLIPGSQEKKNLANLMSPGRRKSDSQRKSITLSGPHSTIRNFQDPNAFAVEKQMVIENAREKILSNKSLQEKLAENINKFLTSDNNNTVQVPKQADSTLTEPEASIDELLGLQSEIHMSEEVIQDILEQTESDPAFQALFDLFDYGNRSGEPPCCPSYQNEDTSSALKNGSNHNELTKRETQGNFPHINSSIQKKDFKTVVPSEQKCNLHITFESVPNLNDFNQRVNSGVECNQHCPELYTSEMPPETEMALEVEKSSLSPNMSAESRLQPDQSQIPMASFISLGETNNDNSVISGRNSQILSQNGPLTEKLSPKSQFCESSSDTGKLRNNSHGSRSPGSSEINQSKMEINNVLAVASQQLSDCQDHSSLQSKTLPASVEGSGSNLPEQQAEAFKQPSSDSSVQLTHAEHENQPSKSEKVALDLQEPPASVKEVGDSIFLSLNEDSCGEVALMPAESNPVGDRHSLPSQSVHSFKGVSHPESQNTNDKTAKDNSSEVDGSNIVSLKIIISDDPFASSDMEINSAVSSISGENLPTIILSSPTKSSAKDAELVKCLSPEETASAMSASDRIESSASLEQSLLALKPEDSARSNTQNEDSVPFSASVVTPCVSKDSGFIQLLPTTSTGFGSSNNILIATCVTDPSALGTTVSQSNVVVLPGNSTPMTAQLPPPQLQTPPRSNSVFAVNQTVSPNFSQGSAIIIASPVQPVLQGMVEMIPVSVVGQNGNTFSAPPRQVLHMPLAAPMCNRSIPQFPISPKTQKTQGQKSKPSTGKQANNLDSNHLMGCHTIRTEVSDKKLITDHGKKVEEVTGPFSVENVVPTGKPFESYRRVLCFDSSAAPLAKAQGADHKVASQNRDKNDTSFANIDSPPVSSTLKSPPSNTIKKEKEKLVVPKTLPRPETATSRHNTTKEGQSEKKASSPETVLESFHKTTANKENELCRDVEKQKNPETSKLSNGQQNSGLWTEKTMTSLQGPTRKQATCSNSKTVVSVGASVKDLKQEQSKSASSLNNPLARHTTEPSQDGQRNSPVNRLTDSTDSAVPRTPGSATMEKLKEEPTEGIKIPSSRRFVDSNIPKAMIPPVTPDLPACSPASETGSENSVNMAAHTLMILSRAAISRSTSSTPLKDNTQQFRSSSRNTTKKRKIEELDECERNSRTSSKNLANSSIPMKKKKIKKKKLPSSFPAGMDVDKFLLSLHYDE